MAVKGHIEIDSELCKGCELCIAFCPKKGVMTLASHLNAAGYAPASFCDEGGKCTGCALCAIVCPEVAIEVYRD